MVKVLITGSDSFIGRNYMLHSKFRDVHEVSLFKKKPDEIDFSSYDVVIHLVAIVHQSKAIPHKEYLRINRDLCLEVANEAKKAKVSQFIFLSTIKVYGESSSGIEVWDEHSICNPSDSYGTSKYEAELLLKEIETEAFAVTIIRTPLVYGQGVRANMHQLIRLINRFAILPLGGIHNNRNFTYVENLIDLVDHIIELRASGTFIAMDDEPLSTTSLVRIIAGALGKKRILFSIPGFVVDIGKKLMPRVFDRLYGSFKLNNSYTKETLGFTPRYTIQEGIQRTVKQAIK